MPDPTSISARRSDQDRDSERNSNKDRLLMREIFNADIAASLGSLDPSLTPIGDMRAELGEGPIWDSNQNCLWWIDIKAHHLHRLQESRLRSWLLPVAPGMVVPTSDGCALVATSSGFEIADPWGSTVTLVAPVEAGLDDRRLNDGAADSVGRVYAGSMRNDARSGSPDGVLYRLDPDLTVTPVMHNIGCPNGMAFPEPDRLLYIDSFQRRVAVWSVDVRTGDLIAEINSIDLSGYDGLPDGMTLDAEGNLWIAFFRGGAVRCLDQTGRLLEVLTIPTPLVTSVAFGGPELDILFVSTAAQDQIDSPLAGALLACRPGVVGTSGPQWVSSTVLALDRSDGQAQ
jgi:sugar lactone lactonase YvrE